MTGAASSSPNVSDISGSCGPRSSLTCSSGTCRLDRNCTVVRMRQVARVIAPRTAMSKFVNPNPLEANDEYFEVSDRSKCNGARDSVVRWAKSLVISMLSVSLIIRFRVSQSTIASINAAPQRKRERRSRRSRQRPPCWAPACWPSDP